MNLCSDCLKNPQQVASVLVARARAVEMQLVYICICMHVCVLITNVYLCVFAFLLKSSSPSLRSWPTDFLISIYLFPPFPEQHHLHSLCMQCQSIHMLPVACSSLDCAVTYRRSHLHFFMQRLVTQLEQLQRAGVLVDGASAFASSSQDFPSSASGSGSLSGPAPLPFINW